MESGVSKRKHHAHDKVLQRVKKEGNIPHTIKRRKANWNCHKLPRNCLVKHAIEGRIKGRGRRGRWHKRLLDDLKGKIRYWKMKE